MISRSNAQGIVNSSEIFGEIIDSGSNEYEQLFK